MASQSKRSLDERVTCMVQSKAHYNAGLAVAHLTDSSSAKPHHLHLAPAAVQLQLDLIELQLEVFSILISPHKVFVALMPAAI
jgi:hypothetical protein